MILWFLFAIMTAAAIFAVLWPLARGRVEKTEGADLAVYRDQLEEIDRDRALGAIGKAEAQAARVEVSRRLIAAADAAATRETFSKPDTMSAQWRRRAAALGGLIVVPAVSVGLYLAFGSPDLPGQPLAQRIAAAQADHQSFAALVARVEAHLEQNPDDGRGWEVIAPVYLRDGRYDDAVKARRNALRLLGETADRQADFGEALVAAANGVVTAEAKQAFDRAVALDPKTVKARYYLGRAAEQDGKREEAARIWRDLLAQAPEGAPWIALVRGSLAELEQPASPGPDAQEMAAAAEMPPAQRNEMIRGMVDRLATRLHQDGSDVDGWLRLVRAYMVLGEREKARTAAADARRALASDPDKLRRLDDGVKVLGVEG
ncbi:MAG TPA: c-type cytochrome biogenesis protein CcmI [Xanthobacteraceae bacterium]|nr:c-type cytochrome biogenesis protein CcmI [Xanthobacteraceae bacterium]